VTNPFIAGQWIAVKAIIHFRQRYGV